MTLIEVIIIAIVEGLTEFLPVSSTGHMIIAQNLLGIESSAFFRAYIVNIQFGAILSVIVLYWKNFFKLNKVKIFDKHELKVKGRSKSFFRFFIERIIFKYNFYFKLLVAFLPAGIIGFLAGDLIDKLLESVVVVAISLLIGGVIMLFVDKWFNRPIENQFITWHRAIKIGFFQCIAMIPGVSRSMASIVGGMTTKLNRQNAAEFSFFLAVPTMAAAAGYTLFKIINDPNGAAMLTENLNSLIIGNIVSFIVAILAIKFFIGFITKYGFKVFGYYRIIVGALILILMIFGVNLSIV